MILEVDYIIVGLGLAGIAFAEKLEENGKSFVVFENNSQTSSYVAGGMYNPVVLKRFTPAWNGHQQLSYALPIYKNIEKKLKVDFDVKFDTKKVFTSIQDQNNWFVALDKPNLAHYMQKDIDKTPLKSIKPNHGFGILKGTGRIETDILIAAYKDYLLEKGSLLEREFKYSELDINKEVLNYHEITASKIVFCEGFGLKQNPFFNYLPLNGTKGEILTIHAPDLKINFLLKSAVFIMPLGNDYYKVGATFNWTDKSLTPTEDGKKELIQKLDLVINVPYTIVNQSAGIRPTVKDRRPLVGKHPEYTNLAILNGLGTRGVMIAPTAANQLFHHLENDETLDSEIDIARFN